MKPTVKIIILDFDGTIGDSYHIIVRTMQATLQALNLPLRSDEECAQMIGLPLKKCFTHLIPMTDEMGDRCAETYMQIFEKNNVAGAVPPFPGAVETLRQLHDAGYVLTLASSRNHTSLAGFVEEYGIQDIISLILGADDVTKAKPHAEPVLLTLQQFGFSADEALVVGDTHFDIAMGKNAGAHTCGVTYGNGSREELVEAGADVIIDQFADLLRIVDR